MGGEVAIAAKRNGKSVCGIGYKGLACLANSLSLLRADPLAWETLFGAQVDGSERQTDYLGSIVEDSQTPCDYGIVCIDLDAKRIDSHQGYGAVGRADISARSELEFLLKAGRLPHPLQGAGILLDAYMGGALVPKGGKPMVCQSLDKERAGIELIDRLGPTGDFTVFGDLAIKPPGWEVVMWGYAGCDGSLFEMARGLAARGWPMGEGVLIGWKAFLAEEHGDFEEAERFDAWIQSLKLASDLTAESCAQTLPSTPKVRI